MHETAHIARKLAALQDLGFERVDASPVTTEAVRVGRRTVKLTQSRPAMGTAVAVSVLAASQHRAQEAIGRAFEEMDRLIRVFSRYESASAVSYLNESGSVSGAPPEFTQVVSHSLRMHELSSGAFDISVAPVLDLFRERMAVSAPVEPSTAEIREALQLVGAAHIDVKQNRVAFKRAGMAVTLDGIAKGFIVDAMTDVLRRHKLKSYLVNAGGDIRTSGTKEGRHPWTVAVQNPTKDGAYPDTIHVTDAAVATSGSYEIYFDRDHLLHHIVNSSTGRSPDECASVSVVAPSTVVADALSTTVFVMGPVEGVHLVDGLQGCECLIIDRDGRHVRSRGWQSATLDNEGQVEA
jgi:thiamine biosynthesis lipoprotein